MLRRGVMQIQTFGPSALAVPTQKHPNLYPETTASFPHSSPGNFVLFLRSCLKNPFVKAHKSLLTSAKLGSGKTAARRLAPLYAQRRITETVKRFWFLWSLYPGQRGKKTSTATICKFLFQNESLSLLEPVSSPC